MQNDDIGEVLGRFVAHLDIRRGAFLDVAQIDDGLDLDGVLLQLIGDVHYHPLHQGAAADGLLHAQFAAFHAAGQIHLAFARQ